MKNLILITLTLISHAAFAAPRSVADGPRIIPGGPIQLENREVFAVDAVVRHADKLFEASRYGKALQVRYLQGIEGSQVQILFGTCTVDPVSICLAKAKLIVDRSVMPVGGLYEHATIEVLSQPKGIDWSDRYALSRITDLIEGLSVLSQDTLELSRAGERVSKGSIQLINPSFSRYQITMQNCSRMEGDTKRCVSVATLVIDARTKRDGLFTKTNYQGKLSYYIRYDQRRK